MEKNKQNSQEDIFLKKYLQEVELETPSSDFTNNIMDILLKEEPQIVLKNEPLISKMSWFVIAGFSLVCLFFLMKEESSSILKLPTIDFNFLSEIQIPNLFDGISISTISLFSISFFAMMIFVQIAYLKNHFNKRFE